MSSSVSVNRLVNEISPYLRQHSTNPVDWRPWDELTLAEVRKKDLPVFLSIGYSSCHWCHVMERESFSSPAVAELLNRHFIPVKVDREEHPEVDHLYMHATRILTGGGGWPNNLWLTPDLQPFAAGTYFSPTSLIEFSSSLARAWEERRSVVESKGRQVVAMLGQISDRASRVSQEPLTVKLLESAAEQLDRAFDQQNGGFEGEPKFPPHNGLRFLLQDQAGMGQGELPNGVRLTLEAMAAGGIRDHLAGGFHRYTVDRQWRVPHFEKILCDNAMMLLNYSLAWAVTGNRLFQQVAIETGDWMIREMSSPDGPFYAAQDADSDGEEGSFYRWTSEQVEQILAPREARLFRAVYGFEGQAGPGPATGENGSSREILPYLPVSIVEYARQHHLRLKKVEDQLARQRSLLLAQRGRRLPPQRDEKILSDWNGLAIFALAMAGGILSRPDYLTAAARAADWLLLNAVSSEGDLAHCFRSRNQPINGYLDDYAFLIRGLLELYAHDDNQRWCDMAEELAWRAVAEFADRKNGGFYFTGKKVNSILRRHRDAFDQVTPSGNAMMTECLLLLYRQTRRSPYLEIAQGTLREFSGVMGAMPLATLGMLTALQEYLKLGEGR